MALLRKYQQLSKQPQTNKESTMKLFTSSSKISLALLTAFAAASTVVTASLSNIKPAAAAQFCQCVHYANNRFQLRPPYERVNGNGTIAVRGSNQGNRGLFGEFNCNNVNVTQFGTSVNGRRDVSFWVR
ncbi:MAG: hypothetical protein EAZ10_09510 [Oscillatoriales cyanobacterium]|nr:MAG: hypothetical protein EAZ10_09510 [Oscillatoriales cyanobacterium]